MDIDAKNGGNEFRFINDFKGIAPKPNVKLDHAYSTTGKNYKKLAN